MFISLQRYVYDLGRVSDNLSFALGKDKLEDACGSSSFSLLSNISD